MKHPKITCSVCQSDSLQPFLQVADHFLTKEKFSLLQCQHCDILHTSPVPDDISRYYDSTEYLSHQLEQKTLIARVYNYVKEIQVNKKIRLIQSFQRDGDILDVGCGTGYFINHSRSSGYKIAGVEINTQARLLAEDLNQIHIFRSLNEIQGSTYDVITLWHVLEHLPDPVDTLRKLYSLLTPGGTLFIAVPNFKSKDAATYKEFWAGYDVPRHLFHFSQKSMTLLSAKSGFQIVQIVPMKYDSFYVSLLSEGYRDSGILRYVKAFINGIKSNSAAAKTTEYSSLIYVLKKV